MFKKRKKSYSDKIFDGMNIAIMLVLLIVFVWPLWYVIIASFSDPSAIWRGEVLLWPVGFTLKAYKAIFEYDLIWIGYRNTIIYTVLGTLMNMVATICVAYPLSFKEFVGKKFCMIYFMITMYFAGGVVPSYLLNVKLGLIDTPWVMILGGCSVYNMLVMRTYFKTSIPGALWEAAKLDGVNNWQYLIKVVLPLSKPVIAVITLYYAVGRWNDYYTGLLYLKSTKYMPLQNITRKVYNSVTSLAENMARGAGGASSSQLLKQQQEMASLLKYTTIICAAAPLLIAYPFIQKYFVKGIMIGSLKE